jgi:hypothetical protein
MTENLFQRAREESRGFSGGSGSHLRMKHWMLQLMSFTTHTTEGIQQDNEVEKGPKLLGKSRKRKRKRAGGGGTREGYLYPRSHPGR